LVFQVVSFLPVFQLNTLPIKYTIKQRKYYRIWFLAFSSENEHLNLYATQENFILSLYFFPRSPHTFSMQMNLCSSLLLFFFFLKISTSAGYMGCLVHIGFFIISPYPRYSFSSLCLLQEVTFLLACRLLALTSLGVSIAKLRSIKS